MVSAVGAAGAGGGSSVNSTDSTTGTLVTQRASAESLLNTSKQLISDAQAIISANVEALADLENSSNPYNKSYNQIYMFENTQSMCGMGMGMGEMGHTSVMTLTGKELLDISSVLLQETNEDGSAMTASQKAEKLKEMGYTAEGDDEQVSLSVTTASGQVTFSDANGDGQLNGLDYDFSEALQAFYQDLQDYTTQKTAIEGSIDTATNTLNEGSQTSASATSTIDSIDTAMVAAADPTWRPYVSNWDTFSEHDLEVNFNGYMQKALRNLDKSDCNQLVLNIRTEVDNAINNLGLDQSQVASLKNHYHGEINAFAREHGLNIGEPDGYATNDTSSTTISSSTAASGSSQSPTLNPTATATTLDTTINPTTVTE